MMTPKSDILTEGFRLDQMYTREKASGDERKGMVRKGEITWTDRQVVLPKEGLGEHTRRKDAQRASSRT